MSGKCLCGEKATKTAYLPVDDESDITEPHSVCEFHADVLRDRGFRVE